MGQLALVNAQNSLAVAQALGAENGRQPDMQSNIAMINTQTTLLTAQANGPNAQAAIEKANATLNGQ